MPKLRRFLFAGQVATVALTLSQLAWSQITPPRIRFPDNGGNPPVVVPPTQPGAIGAPVLTNPPGFTPPTITVDPVAPLSSPATPIPQLNTTPPPVTLNGTIQPPPGFDPYADPTRAPGPIYTPGAPGIAPPVVNDPFAPGAIPVTPGVQSQPLVGYATFGQWPRFLQQVRLRHTWLNRQGSSGLGWNTSELSGTFLFPFFFRQNAPLLVTPGFALHATDGPDGAVGFSPFLPAPGLVPLNTGANLPSRLYDAYVDVAWTPQITYAMSADVGFRAGVYSDFGKLNKDSVRFQGRGYGVWRTSDTHEWRAGVVYVDRVNIKLLPAGGLIWTPGGANGNIRWEILFPNPKFSQRLTTWRNTDVWWYVAGEYGGGSWQADRLIVNTLTGSRSTFTDRFDYNDIRIILGLETFSHYGVKGFAEAGYVFNRELDFVSNAFDFEPKSTFMIRGGLTY